MKINRYRSLPRRSSQHGQTLIPIVIFIGLFLMAMLGVAADYTQVWAHRQMAQGAADAACEATAADLYLNAIDPAASGTGGLLPFDFIGTDFDCTTFTSSPPCQYASLNGYSGAGVHVSFPSSLPGVDPLPSQLATAHPYVEVTITDPVSTSFTRMVGAAPTVNIKAKAGCGVTPVAVPVPLVVLHQTADQSLSTQGSGGIQILGGPIRSIQVDSRSASAVNVGGSATIDLTQAGPNGTGGDVGVFGTESQPGGVQLGTGKWISPTSPFGDPWALTSEPPLPATIGRSRPVAFGTSGCPDPAGCVQFTAGDYSGTVSATNCATGNITYLNVNNEPNGCLILPITLRINDRSKNHAYNILGEVILPTNNNPGNFAYKVTTIGTSANTNNNAFPGALPWNQAVGGTQADGATLKWTNIGVLPSGSLSTAIFDPGIYYVGVEGLQLGAGSTVRPSTATGDASGGPTFFFSHDPGSGKNLGTVTVDANSGKASACTTVTPVSPANCIVSYKVDGTALVGVTSRALQCPGGPANPPQVPSTIDGNVLLGPCSGTYGSSDSKTRGFLFFQKRSTAVSASWGGGAGSLVSGFLYFHNTSYNSQISMSGGSSSAALSLGNMVADKVQLGGGSGIKMILNSQVTFQVLKPTLLE